MVVDARSAAFHATRPRRGAGPWVRRSVPWAKRGVGDGGARVRRGAVRTRYAPAACLHVEQYPDPWCLAPPVVEGRRATRPLSCRAKAVRGRAERHSAVAHRLGRRPHGPTDALASAEKPEQAIERVKAPYPATEHWGVG